jgi:hypothetical protein
MADELVFYTNPQSRGRIARWMLEEVGQPYKTEVMDYASTMKAPAYLAVNPMGKVPALRSRRRRRHRNRRDLRLSRRRLSPSQTGAAFRRPDARTLLPLDVLRRRSGRGGDEQQGTQLCRAAGTRAHDRLWHLCALTMNALEMRRSRMVNTYLAILSALPTSMSVQPSALA